MKLKSFCVLILLITLIVSSCPIRERSQIAGLQPNTALAQSPTADIPAAAWSRPIGQPLENPAVTKVRTYYTIDDGPRQGLPVGGFGAGTFATAYDGVPARNHLIPGAHYYAPNPVMVFSVYATQGDTSVAQALWTGKPAAGQTAWQWEYPVGAGTYYALYPRSWFVYDWDQLPVELMVEQFSPIIPDNYRETSYPIALYNWTATNPTDQPVTLGIMFTSQNPLYTGSGRTQTVREIDIDQGHVVGIEFGQNAAFGPNGEQATFAIAALETPGVTISYHTPWEITETSAEIWDDFAADGVLDNTDDSTPSGPADHPAGALAVTMQLAPGETRTVPYAVAWDIPITFFGRSEYWYKRYTAFYGRDGDNAFTIATDGLSQMDDWREAIIAWQEPILNDDSRPEWYKTALFNELYYLADGGTAWEQGRVGEPDPGADYLGHFAYLECFDYPFYNTFDVDFYASFALMNLWPEIEIGIMRDFAATVGQEDRIRWPIGYTGEVTYRKALGAVPHDLGTPQEAPWIKPNAYNWQNINNWKDLNAKFVLRLYRDAVLLDRPELVEEMWDDAVMALDYLAAMDENGDGIPENDGLPDQTYDTWAATGISAYSGDLWLAALAAMHEMALMVGDDDAAADYAAMLDTAVTLYDDTLWTGTHYAYDETSDAIMADQLAGEWYARISGIPVLPDDRVDTALATVYEHNVADFEDGQLGAINGINMDGSPVGSEQANEVWTGTTYMLAAHMLLRGLDDEGWATAYGIYQHTYVTGGLWFRTPEAWDRYGNFRASMYMRPLAIWAIESALAAQ